MDTGIRLRQQRKRQKFTLGQISEYENLSKSYLSNLESGVNTPPTWPLLARLARRYRTSADYLLGLVDNPAGQQGLAPDEEILLTAWQGLHAEQRAVLLELLQDGTSLEMLLDAVRALGALNRRMAPRIIGGMPEDSEEPTNKIRGTAEDKRSDL